ncbi:type IA DNA topoisomerase [Paenibacillus agilis]|uniref:DNA topoisomerase n=1 Tax=Paenibacillus agilis TaxID=3020863 RepID=A0A559ID28_9BACL|nr:type IA DNA topoisomerase [Paenibacillus agilis]TVX85578.1 type IA DNA topoisomerase [Paenibacillus agilis]
MYNRVIIAEKPDMGDNIAQALGIAKKMRGHIILKNGDVVTWGIGHLIRLKTPDTYPEFKEWTWDALPVIPQKMLTEVDPKKIEQFNVVKELLANSKECILALDPDREGEWIGRLLLRQCGYQKKWKRLWIDDLTESTILAGMNNLRDSDEFNSLGDAAEVRSYADYWLGFTASRFFSLLAQDVTGGKANLSAGRVQTPTLRLVYDREISMESFKPKPFCHLIATINTDQGSFKSQWFKEESGKKVSRFEDQAKANQMKDKIIGQTGIIESFTIKEVKRYAPKLLNSSGLKTQARKQLGFSTVKSTAALQALYDKGYVSYPRADSNHLSSNKADELAAHLIVLREKSEYAKFFPSEICSLNGNTRFVDDKKAATHHAIVPTSKNPLLQAKDSKDALKPDEAKLYELILKHTLAAHHPVGMDREKEVITEIAGETFYTRSTEIVTPGWRMFLKGEELDVHQTEPELGTIPPLQEGIEAAAAAAEFIKGQTSKPKRLNDDELEVLMKNAGQYAEEGIDDDVLEAIKDKGIGTAATRTNIVQKLVSQEYIEITKNLVYLTKKGRSFMEMVYEHPIASVELTGEFEAKLAQVEKGLITTESLIQEFKQLAHDILKDKEALRKRIQSLPNGHTFENIEEVGQCPKCQSIVVEKKQLYHCIAGKEECDFVLWKEFRGVPIKSKQAISLLDGKEVLLSKVPGKEGKEPYDLYIKLLNGVIETRLPTIDDKSLGSCPTCSKPVIEGPKGYGCSGWREGCKFVLWKTYRDIAIPANAAKMLLAGKQVLVKDIVGKKGTYDLIFFMKDGKVETRFPEAADQSIGICPLCKKPVIESEKIYGCSGWRDGCKFKLTKEFLGKKITLSQIKKLLKNGKTDKIEGFTGSKGLFDTALGYDREANRYSFIK